MSRPKDPTRYPDFCYQLIDEFQKDPEAVFSFSCDTQGEAKNFQITFNSFKKAAYEAGWAESRCAVLPNIVARIVKQEDGTIKVMVSNINSIGAVARWNREAKRDS